MAKLSGKIVKLLPDNATAVTLFYDDMKTVMKMVNSVLEQGYSKGEKS